MAADRVTDMYTGRVANRRVREAQEQLSEAVARRATVAWLLHTEHRLSWREVARAIGMPAGAHSQLWTEVQQHVPEAHDATG